MTVGAMRASPTVVDMPSFLGSGSLKLSPLFSNTPKKRVSALTRYITHERKHSFAMMTILWIRNKRNMNSTIPSSKREPIRMNPTGRKTYKDVSLNNVFAINDLILFHSTHSETT
jgi:hypothetical protein